MKIVTIYEQLKKNSLHSIDLRTCNTGLPVGRSIVLVGNESSQSEKIL